MRAPRPGALAASAVLAGFGAVLVVTGLTRPGEPPVRESTRWVPAEALIEAPPSSPSSPLPSSPLPSFSLTPVDPRTEADSVPAPPAAGDDPGGAVSGGATRGDVAAPVRLEIPRIGVRTALGTVGRDAAGAIDVPQAGVSGGRDAFWYRGLVAPGAVGPAVLVGHVDSRTGGPAVFYRLGELTPGDAVTVRRADGSSVRFVVRALGRYPKAAFPGDAVYGPTPGPELRLITCGGGFDSRHGTYRDNLVVFATAAR
jgi:hypothetical protein